MKQIISGMVYDTETATELHQHTDRDGDSHTLYISPKDQLFVWEEFITEYDHNSLHLISKSKVEEWLLTHNCTDSKVYEKLGFTLEEG